jgi:hypothetical protein
LDKIESLQKRPDIMLQLRPRCQDKTVTPHTDPFPDGCFYWLFLTSRGVEPVRGGIAWGLAKPPIASDLRRTGGQVKSIY